MIIKKINITDNNNNNNQQQQKNKQQEPERSNKKKSVRSRNDHMKRERVRVEGISHTPWMT